MSMSNVEGSPFSDHARSERPWTRGIELPDSGHTRSEPRWTRPDTPEIELTDSPTPSPPQDVFKVFKLISSIYQGLHNSEIDEYRFPFSPVQFEQLQKEISRDSKLEDWVECKLRWGYSSLNGELVIRMAQTIHEIVGGKLADVLFDALRACAQASRHVTNIAKWYSSPVKLSDDSDKRHPDASFAYASATRQPLVVEVAHSQKYEDARKKAEWYGFGSGGLVRTIFLVDIEYWNPTMRQNPPPRVRRITYQIYRMRNIPLPSGGFRLEMERDSVLLRDSSGIVTPGNTSFKLSDFVPHRNWSATDVDADITLPHADFIALIEAAEKVQAKQDSGFSPVPVPAEIVRLPKSPPTKRYRDDDDDEDNPEVIPSKKPRVFRGEEPANLVGQQDGANQVEQEEGDQEAQEEDGSEEEPESDTVDGETDQDA
ncbi:hypothetical protein BDV95DRAFT_569390 [Massariosphaeria phaeospora]|uniref:Restriction endonuclease-domain-containing protein n=1 Tax=Massariosphaeria phaeospora TaxID=100035 RepID=A0A7C8I6Z9_9PLEO|nr:hypothetical protein BDV95DRAFT_569390 [Massariosphaeria phaeospora]